MCCLKGFVSCRQTVLSRTDRFVFSSVLIREQRRLKASTNKCLRFFSRPKRSFSFSLSYPRSFHFYYLPLSASRLSNTSPVSVRLIKSVFSGCHGSHLLCFHCRLIIGWTEPLFMCSPVCKKICVSALVNLSLSCCLRVSVDLLSVIIALVFPSTCFVGAVNGRTGTFK